MKLNILTLAGALLVLGVSSQPLLAQDEAPQQNQRGQGRGQGQGFDPEQMRQRMMERMKERFEVTNDDEWKIISERLQKVTAARTATGTGFGAFGRGGPGGPGGPGGQGGDRAQGGGGGGGGRRGEASPEADELQKALDAKASKDEIKAKIARLRDARKANEGKLEKAQEELRAVLNIRQEAVAIMMGLLK